MKFLKQIGLNMTYKLHNSGHDKVIKGYNSHMKTKFNFIPP